MEIQKDQMMLEINFRIFTPSVDCICKFSGNGNGTEGEKLKEIARLFADGFGLALPEKFTVVAPQINAGKF